MHNNLHELRCAQLVEQHSRTLTDRASSRHLGECSHQLHAYGPPCMMRATSLPLMNAAAAMQLQMGSMLFAPALPSRTKTHQTFLSLPSDKFMPTESRHDLFARADRDARGETAALGREQLRLIGQDTSRLGTLLAESTKNEANISAAYVFLQFLDARVLASERNYKTSVTTRIGDADHCGALFAGEAFSEHTEPVGDRRLVSMTAETLCEHFHLPLLVVAQKFGMCTTTFKKVCRRLGITRWPQRQVLAKSYPVCMCLIPIHMINRPLF
jgi:hypothetical protein